MMISGVACCDSVDNFSDHPPLSFTLVFGWPKPSFVSTGSNSSLNSNSSQLHESAFTNWEKVTELEASNYRNFVSHNLPVFPKDVLSCCDPLCLLHTSGLGTAWSALIMCLEAGADCCLPRRNASKRRILPDHARSLRQTATFWHHLWEECGCPSSGVMFEIKKR